MIRVDLPDIRTADRLIEALYVAAGARHTAQAHEWRHIAQQLEEALDNLPPQPITDTA
ncbi:hypothetical protein [Streptomyces sp. NPDC004008]